MWESYLSTHLTLGRKANKRISLKCCTMLSIVDRFLIIRVLGCEYYDMNKMWWCHKYLLRRDIKKTSLFCLFQLHRKVTCWAFTEGGRRKEESQSPARPEGRQREGARKGCDWEGEAVQQCILPRTCPKASKAGSRQLERWNIKIMTYLYWLIEKCYLWRTNILTSVFPNEANVKSPEERR